MRIDKLAMTSREALQTAMSTAADAQAGAVEPIHLLSALLGAGERNISVIIERIGADPAQLARSTQDAIDHAPKVSGEGQQMGLSNELVRVIEKAEKKATKMGDSFVVTEHLLMALAEDKGDAGRVLRDASLYGDYPCHRVVNHAGRLAPGWPEQAELLRDEGVPLRDDNHADMRFQWREEDE